MTDTASGENVLEVENLRVHYLTRFGVRVQAVDGVSFKLKRGEILGIAGESGCGKTTLVSGCMGLFIPPLHHSSGEVRIAGKSIIGLGLDRIRREVLGQQIAIIPQGALNSLNPTRKIKDLAADVILSHEQPLGRGGARSPEAHGQGNSAETKSIHERLRERFERIGLDANRVLNAYPVELPAGTKQRVVIGISTLLNPKVVVADEPSSALDVSTQKAVIRLLFELLDQGIVESMLFITHELPLLRHVSSSIAVMYAGEFVEVGKTEQVIFDSRQPYTKALMSSMLSAEPGQKTRKPVALEGAPPNLAQAIEGCRFAERCPNVQANCRTDRPELRIVADRLVRCHYAS